MWRLRADREEKRVTRGNVTNPEQDGLTPYYSIREGSYAIFWLAILVLVSVVSGGMVLAAAVARSNYMTNVGVALEQLVPFSRKHHVGELARRIHCKVASVA